MSHSCGHEAHDHDHHHGHDGHDGHDHDGPDRGLEMSLYQQIALDSVICLNEAVPGSAKKVFKTWERRFDTTDVLESDADEQLIIFIPFTAALRIKSIAILGLPDDSAPEKLQAFVNREDVDFDSVGDIEPTQEWDLVQNVPAGEIPEYPTKMTKFTNVRNLTLFIPSNFGADVSKITYIGLKGEWTPLTKDPIITLYEAAPNPADHAKIQGLTNSSSSIL